MEARFIALLSCLIFGFVMGIFTTQTSARRDPIYGGTASRALHYLMASIVTAMPITILICVIVGGFLFAITVAAGLIISLWTTALIFASFERPAREAALADKANQGWTEQDARTSGL